MMQTHIPTVLTVTWNFPVTYEWLSIYISVVQLNSQWLGSLPLNKTIQTDEVSVKIIL